ncbi:hypothetical protein EUTSA_v10014950mg [Eutrema salsugineum]|uniref:Uncharacterized protein n=1 Tax=Eutrema salsugineum TaxID=72664 RepID=V4L8Q1_EUTSA|nr:uncharacterized protein LOC18017625 [Eutrema salsugineum]ESQ40004.1 hypothetical protein EUTSA_v10014950mg [Eutrema salsugineum]
MDQRENEVGWMNEVSDGESFIEIQINKPAAGLSILSSSSSSSSPSPGDDKQATAIFSSTSSCFSVYSSATRLMVKLGCLSIVGVIREKVNVGEKWVLKVIHGRRNKSSLHYYCEGSAKYSEETLTDDSLKAAIAYCNASSLSRLHT